MNRFHYNVNGLQNTAIKTQIKNALENVKGVQMINIDFDRGAIEIGCSSTVDENQIRSCIERTGCRIE